MLRELIILLLTYLELVYSDNVVAFLLGHVLTVLLIGILLGTLVLGVVQLVALVLNNHLAELGLGVFMGDLLLLRKDGVQGGLVLLGAGGDGQGIGVVEFVAVVEGYLVGVVADVARTTPAADLAMGVDVVAAAGVHVQV